MRPLQLKTQARPWIPDQVRDDRGGKAGTTKSFTSFRMTISWMIAALDGAAMNAERPGRMRCGPYDKRRKSEGKRRHLMAGV